MIKRIRLANIWVSDQEKARDFYVNKCGFSVQSDHTMPDGYRWLEVVPPGAETAVAVTKPYDGQPAPIGGITNLIFTTDDIEATYEGMKANGVHFIEPPTLQPWGNKQACFADPDGNTFLLVDRE